MAYAEKRDGKPTGRFWGEALVTPKGKPQVRFKQAFDTLKAAQGYEVYVKLMGEEPPVVGRALSGHTFADVARECKAKGGPTGKWLSGKDHSIVQRVDHVVGIVGHMDIVDFKRGDYQLIVDDLRKRPPNAERQAGATISNATINRYLNACSSVLSFAVLAEYRESKPKVPRLPVTENPRGIIHTYDQEEAILRAMRAAGDTVGAVCVQVLLDTGLRSSELLTKLRPDQIVTETDGEQNTTTMIRLDANQTKNGTARKVPIDPDLAREIRAIIASGTRPTPAQLLKQFKKARDACGDQKNLVIHSLRHTRNTRMRKAGVDIKIRMKSLGHKDVATSMRYDHIDDADLLEAAKKVEQARGDQQQKGDVVPFRTKLTG